MFSHFLKRKKEKRGKKRKHMPSVVYLSLINVFQIFCWSIRILKICRSEWALWWQLNWKQLLRKWRLTSLRMMMSLKNLRLMKVWLETICLFCSFPCLDSFTIAFNLHSFFIYQCLCCAISPLFQPKECECYATVWKSWY